MKTDEKNLTLQIIWTIYNYKYKLGILQWRKCLKNGYFYTVLKLPGNLWLAQIFNKFPYPKYYISYTYCSHPTLLRYIGMIMWNRSIVVVALLATLTATYPCIIQRDGTQWVLYYNMCVSHRCTIILNYVISYPGTDETILYIHIISSGSVTCYLHVYIVRL